MTVVCVIPVIPTQPARRGRPHPASQRGTVRLRGVENLPRGSTAPSGSTDSPGGVDSWVCAHTQASTTLTTILPNQSIDIVISIEIPGEICLCVQIDKLSLKFMEIPKARIAMARNHLDGKEGNSWVTHSPTDGLPSRSC